ncbi:MAG: STAS domain-containing protein [Pseudomonadota bacterium]
MSDAPDIVEVGEGRFSLKGDLTFDTVARLLERGTRHFTEHSRIIVDMAQVGRTDSAGLALLMEWVGWANHSVREIRYENVPERLVSIAAISEVEGMLQAGERWTGFI